jgi:hypothetical protein
MRKLNLALASAAGAVVLGISTAASAHECFIANRSDHGNANATHSANWTTVTVDGFAHSPDFPPGVDPDCFVAYWTAHGGPASFTVRSDTTIGEGSANPNLGNGKGLDHIEDAYGALTDAAFGACAV